VITELVEFFRNEFLTLGAFALAAERSILSDCLAAAMSEPSELLSGPTDTEYTSDLRGWEESPFEGT
jgi:hypothetical protein